ncbi:MAG: peptidoglycan binding domain-containing protein [Lachnospiraceae bacterium]|nr:peptidoglycan binding domain-containing protein [Lachnospiraceae bacterium]
MEFRDIKDLKVIKKISESKVIKNIKGLNLFGRRDTDVPETVMRKILRRTLMTIGVSVGIAYIAGIIILAGRFQANTSINGVEVSHMTAEEAEEKYMQAYNDWQLTIKTIEGDEEVIYGEEINFDISMKPTFKQMVNRQMFILWPLTPYLRTNIKSKGSSVFDEAMLKKAIDELYCVSGDEIRPPVDAHIARAEDGHYEIVEADDGNTLNRDRTYQAIAQAISDGEMQIDLDKAGCYEKAKIYSDDPALQETFAPIDRFQQMNLELDMGGGASLNISKEVYGAWLDFDSVSGAVTVDEDRVRDYVRSLYGQYSTLGTKREFHANAGDTVMVGGSKYDNYGWDLNIDGTTKTLVDAVRADESTNLSCSWDQTGVTRDENGADFGNTYIEISLDEQVMWYYIDGEQVLSTRIVSGLPTQRRATPCGCFQVLDQLRDHTMEGSYGSAYASYVIAIMDNGICIHDSSWRGEYGGDIWLYDGSHGCINTPYYQVQKLYNNVWTGVPVIIYDRGNTVPEVESYYD